MLVRHVAHRARRDQKARLRTGSRPGLARGRRASGPGAGGPAREQVLEQVAAQALALRLQKALGLDVGLGRVASRRR